MRKLMGKRRAVVVLALILVLLPAGGAGAAGPRPPFQLPFRCGEQWRLDTWGHYPALDMVKEPNQVGTEGSPVLATAAGTVNQSFFHTNGGNLVQIDHGGGWFTTSIHLQDRLVQVGQRVEQGQQIGTVGRTGAGSNNHPHLHYEQAIDANGDGRASWGAAGTERVQAYFDGTAHGTGNSQTFRYVTSRNCPGTGGESLVETGDFTGDGKADIGAQYRGNGDLRVWRSTGVFADAQLFSGGTAKVGSGWGSANVERIVTGDFNGDGRTDIAAQYRGSGDLRAWYSTGDLAGDGRLFAGGALVGQGWGGANVERIITGDFNGDGKVDIGAQYRGSGDLRVWASTGVFADGQLFSGGTAKVGSGWGPANVERIVTDDFNGDGRTDIAAQYRGTGDVRAWSSTGDLSGDGRLFAGGVLVGQGWGNANVERILTDDFTGDGKADIGAQYVGSGDLRVWASTGDLSADGRLFAGGTAKVGAGWGGANVERIVTGDFNGDGRTDIGAQYRGSGDLRAWYSTGDLSGDGRLFAGGALAGQGWGGANVERII